MDYRFIYVDREKIVFEFPDDKEARTFAIAEESVVEVQQESTRRVVWRRIPPGDPWRNKRRVR